MAETLLNFNIWSSEKHFKNFTWNKRFLRKKLLMNRKVAHALNCFMEFLIIHLSLNSFLWALKWSSWKSILVIFQKISNIIFLIKIISLQNKNVNEGKFCIRYIYILMFLWKCLLFCFSFFFALFCFSTETQLLRRIKEIIQEKLLFYHNHNKSAFLLSFHRIFSQNHSVSKKCL